MFLKNKYSKWYYKIISNAQERDSDLFSYTEKHHIIPKSLGGNNSLDNIVVLSGREHFICHMLLTKMTNGEDKSKMIYAAWLLANVKTIHQDRIVINSKTYEIIRKQFSVSHANHRKGYTHSIETKSKMSASNKGKIKPFKGIPRSTEIRKKISASLTGIPKSQTHIQNLKSSHVGFTGKKATAEHKAKISEKRKLTPKVVCEFCGILIDPGNYANSHGIKCIKNPDRVIIIRKTKECEYCGIIVSPSNYARWHGANCRSGRT